MCNAKCSQENVYDVLASQAGKWHFQYLQSVRAGYERHKSQHTEQVRAHASVSLLSFINSSVSMLRRGNAFDVSSAA